MCQLLVYNPHQAKPSASYAGVVVVGFEINPLLISLWGGF